MHFIGRTPEFFPVYVGIALVVGLILGKILFAAGLFLKCALDDLIYVIKWRRNRFMK